MNGAILIVLALATSQVARADGASRRSNDVPAPPPTYEPRLPSDYRPPQPTTEPRERTREPRDEYRRWVPFGRSAAANSSRQTFDIDGRGGRIDRLMVIADRGALRVKWIQVEYMDRGTEILKLDQRLRKGASQVIDLDGDRRIGRIVVITDPRDRGAYSVYGA